MPWPTLRGPSPRSEDTQHYRSVGPRGSINHRGSDNEDLNSPQRQWCHVLPLDGVRELLTYTMDGVRELLTYTMDGVTVEDPEHCPGARDIPIKPLFVNATSYTPAIPYARQQPAALLTPPASLNRQPPSVHPGLVMPRGVVPQAADGPCDAALDTSPPEPPGETSSGLGARDVPVPTDVDPDASLPASQSPRLGQPCRARRPPRRYEPETGRWIQD
ncbi:unnamed protein product [Boreogadus saida]